MPTSECMMIELVQLLRSVSTENNHANDSGANANGNLKPMVPPPGTLNFPNYCPSGVVGANAPFAPLPQSTLCPALLQSFHKAVEALKKGMSVPTPPTVPPAAPAAAPAVPSAAPSVVPVAVVAAPPPAAANPAIPALPVATDVHVMTVVSSKSGCKIVAELNIIPYNYYPYHTSVSAYMLRCFCEKADGSTQEALTDKFDLTQEPLVKHTYNFHEFNVNKFEQSDQATSINLHLATVGSMLQKLLDPETEESIPTASSTNEAREMHQEEEEEKKESSTEQESTSQSSPEKVNSPAPVVELNARQLFDDLQTRLNVLRSTMHFELPHHRELARKKQAVTLENLYPSEADIRSLAQKTEAIAEPHSFRRVDNPVLTERFLEVYREYSEKGLGHIEMAFHGTNHEWVQSIEVNGLLIPGQIVPSTGDELPIRTDNGYSGKGVYLSPQFGYSQGYSSGFGSIFVCLVLSGRVYDCTLVEEGRGLEPGYDSHRGCDGCEWVIFDTRAVLPIFVVENAESAANS